MLTKDDLVILQRPFTQDEHEFLNKSGQNLAYLTEDAVALRLEEIDPSWSFDILSIERSGDQSIVRAVLTVKGVSRAGVGMQKVEDKHGEAEKGAATDALKRCARLFGIGRYLLGAPKNQGDFNKWLAKLSGTPTSSSNGLPKKRDAAAWDAIYRDCASVYTDRALFNSRAKELFSEGVLNEGMTNVQIIGILIDDQKLAAL